MIHFIVVYLPWLMSATTVLAMYLAGEKKPSAWILSIANQMLWLIWILASQSWGLLPMNAALWVVFIRNYRKWS